HDLIEEYIKICIVSGRPDEYRIIEGNKKIQNAINAVSFLVYTLL
ncbi:unnamed protein product, partial [marine sediment metagenome]